MTKMVSIPKNHNKIRRGVVELLKTVRSSAFQARDQAPLPVISRTRKYTDSAAFLYLVHDSGARIE
jgi:hypothetical protein